ncbi:hypothetical protein N7366_04465 [Aeromonas caviae]|uniref:Uncharacterized protein n=1 Tax=Aeromonas salmonicida subsp. pectinolytica 34mel TaxID=1324960 RepID=T0QYQ9_AERSA|nr:MULTISPECIES: hypothetical protein [Aeromonas]ATP10922.1 uncharacterized protein Asalp_38370 [Aeromonas salmonicida subsp. pectinolytica 34mel]EQC04248.1 hypothetical protein K931_11309 [Aeromonas salmonicida subsp. pectinolytica 34mel]MDH0432556.1 hypothetical protein [Aeromonas caviae]MDH0935405.1 hypothetical protein [Aeromonas caviae]MDH1396208.1 hypothetical protein [Aeromonas caviae]
MAKATQPAASAAPVWTVIKSAKAPKISARASGLLHYEVGKNDEGRYALRITANDTGGLFSKHWLSLDDILALLDILKDAPFKSVALKALFVRGSANNHGFLAAILRAEKLLVAAEPNSPFHRAGLSLSDWSTQLDEPANMDKQARKGKAKGQKGQDDTTDEITIEKGNEPQFLETANDQAGLSDKMDETGGEVETADPAASEEAQQ